MSWRNKPPPGPKPEPPPAPPPRRGARCELCGSNEAVVKGVCQECFENLEEMYEEAEG